MMSDQKDWPVSFFTLLVCFLVRASSAVVYRANGEHKTR